MNSRPVLAKNQDEATIQQADDDHRIYETFRHFWHPVARASDLGADPMGVELCEQHLVIVRLDGQVVAMNDLCAHRGSALSLGEVTGEGTRLRCAYHGWQYDQTGKCKLVPQAPDLAESLDISVRSYQVEEKYGLIWVCLEDDARFPLPEFPQYDDPAFYWVEFPVVDWNCAAPRRIENYTDVSHFAFIHDGWLGNKNHPEVNAYKVWRDGTTLCMTEDAPVLQPAKLSKWSDLETDAEYLEVNNVRTISMPLTVQLDISTADRCFSQFFCAAPLGPGRTRNFTVVARNFGEPGTAYKDHAEFNMTIYEQDRPVVESQRPNGIPPDLAAELHVRGVDLYSLEYRRWLKEIVDDLEPDTPDDALPDGMPTLTDSEQRG